MSHSPSPSDLIGFAHVTSVHGDVVEIQESSSTLSVTPRSEINSPFVWLSITSAPGAVDETRARAHLSEDDARWIRDGLTAWLEQTDSEQSDDEQSASDADALAREIRHVDGAHTLGAAALADALRPFLARIRKEEREKAAEIVLDSNWALGSIAARIRKDQS